MDRLALPRRADDLPFRLMSDAKIIVHPHPREIRVFRSTILSFSYRKAW
jgi:hypothetical protein